MGRGLEIDPIKVETKVWSPPREWRTPPDSFRAIFVRGENDGNLNLISYSLHARLGKNCSFLGIKYSFTTRAFLVKEFINSLFG